MTIINHLFPIIGLIFLILCSSCSTNSNDDSAYENPLEIESEKNIAALKELLKDPNSINQDFTEELELLGIDETVSTDHKIRVFSWISSYGSAPDWTCFTQYVTEQGEVKCIEGLPVPENYGTYTVSDIITSETIDGRTVYIVNLYANASGWLGSSLIVPVIIKDDKFIHGPKFKEDYSINQTIGFEFSIPDWYAKANNGEGWSWKCTYSKKTRRLYISDILESSCSMLTDQYSIFKYDGEYFSFIEKSGSERLHPSLRNFLSLEATYHTDGHVVRVDQLKDNRYRLALWDKTAKTSTKSKPDIILYTKEYDEKKGYFIFRDGDVKFIVGDAYTSKGIQVYYKHKLLFTGKKSYTMDSMRSSLHISVNESSEVFKDKVSPILIYVTERLVVLVSKSPSDGYIYKVWNAKEDISFENKPALVLSNGYLSDYGFIFRNKDYEYHVPRYDTNAFYVYHNGEIIRNERILWSYTADDINELRDSGCIDFGSDE